MNVKRVKHSEFSEECDVIDAIEDGPDGVLWLVPTEDDALALWGEDQHATSWWGEFSSAHAERLRGFRGLLLVGVTVDDAGAYCAAHRWRVLHPAVGLRRVQFRAPARDLWEGATLADHLGEGYGLDDTRRVSLRDMRDALDREQARRRRAQTPPLRTEQLQPLARAKAG